MTSVVDLQLPNPSREVVELLNDYAVRLRAQGRYTTALVAVRRALALDPLIPELWANLGCILWNMGRPEEALEPMRKATALGPGKALHWGNLALLYGALRRYDDAELAYVECIKRATTRMEVVGAQWDRSLMRLERGQWFEGFGEYESRIERRGPPLYPKFPVPLWAGEDLDGKSLYVQSEQGIGDIILFSRCLAEVHRRWPTCKIKFCVHDKLWNLLWEYRHFIEFIPGGTPWPEGLDYGTFLASIPGLLSLTLADVPPDPGLIRKRCERDRNTFNCPTPHLPSLKVGIAWTGNPEQDRNVERSIPLEKLLSLAEDPHVVLYSFQVGHGADDIDRLGADQIVFPLGAEFEKSGLVSAGVAMLDMDLIITVCTSTAHLAGALSVPVIVMLCHDPYWIWLQDGSTQELSPWYPTAKLFRQPSPGDWDSVISRIKTELKKLHAARNGAPAIILGDLING